MLKIITIKSSNLLIFMISGSIVRSFSCYIFSFKIQQPLKQIYGLRQDQGLASDGSLLHYHDSWCYSTRNTSTLMGTLLPLMYYSNY